MGHRRLQHGSTSPHYKLTCCACLGWFCENRRKNNISFGISAIFTDEVSPLQSNHKHTSLLSKREIYKTFDQGKQTALLQGKKSFGRLILDVDGATLQLSLTLENHFGHPLNFSFSSFKCHLHNLLLSCYSKINFDGNVMDSLANDQRVISLLQKY